MFTHETPLKYLTTSRIGEKRPANRSQTVPRRLGFGDCAPFAVLRLGDGLILLPEQQRFDRLCQQIGSALSAAGITPDDVLKTLPAARERIFERRYGNASPGKRRGPRAK